MEEGITKCSTGGIIPNLLTDGPLKQETEFVLHLDGTTVGEVDLDKLGGKTSATSKIVSETTLMSYLKKPDSQEIFVTANRTLYPGKKKQSLFDLLNEFVNQCH